MTRYPTLLLGLLAAVLAVGDAIAIDLPTLYLRRLTAEQAASAGLLGEFALYPCLTSRADEHSQLIHVRTQREEAFPPFFGLPESEPYVLPQGEARASLILTTGANGTMPNCAGVTVELFRESAGGRVALASGTVTTTLVPPSAGGTATPIQVPITIASSAEARTFAEGEAMSAVVLVQNTCGDESGRNITLRFDAIDRLSRIEFDEVPPPDTGGPLDPDGDAVFSLCDNCPEAPNPDQGDHDGDGQGDICTECTIGGINPPSCNCEISPCDDDDVCTFNACDQEQGCVVDPLLFLAAVQCRLDAIDDAIVNATPDELTPKLARRKGPLRKLIRKDRKAAQKAQAAIDAGRPARKIGRKVNKVRRILGKFVDKVEALPGGVSPDLKEQLLQNAELADQAIRAGQSS